MIKSIFGLTPREVREKQIKQELELAAQLQEQNTSPFAATFGVSFGAGLGRGLMSHLGYEDQDMKEARQVEELQQYMSSLDLTSEQGNLELADVYRHFGYFDEATKHIERAEEISKSNRKLSEVNEPTKNQIKIVESYLKSRFVAPKGEGGFLFFGGADGVDKDLLTEMATNIAFEVEQRKADARVAGITDLKQTDFLTAAINKFTSPYSKDGSTNVNQMYDFKIDENGRWTKFKGYKQGVDNPFYNERLAEQKAIDEQTRDAQREVIDQSIEETYGN